MAKIPQKFAKNRKKIAITGRGGGPPKLHMVLGGLAKKPCLSTREAGGGVKNGQKSVHIVYG